MDTQLKQFLEDYNNGATPPRAAEHPAQAGKALVAELITLRRQAHLTQADLAKKVGMSQSSLARIESGKVTPNLDTFTKLAAALDAHVSLQAKP